VLQPEEADTGGVKRGENPLKGSEEIKLQSAV